MVYFIFLALAGILVEPAVFLVPLGLVNAIFIRSRRVRLILTYLVAVPSIAFIFGNTAAFGLSYLLVLFLPLFIVTFIFQKKTVLPWLFAGLFAVMTYSVAGVFSVPLGFGSLFISAVVILVVRKLPITIFVRDRADIAIQWVILGALLPTLFFFWPPCYPSSLFARQQGVEAIVGVDADAELRDFLLFRRPNFVAKVREDRLRIGAKYHLFNRQSRRPVQVEMDLNGKHLTPYDSKSEAFELVRCPNGELVDFDHDFKDENELRDLQYGSCLSGSAFVVTQSMHLCLLLDRATGAILFRKHYENSNSFKVAPFKENKFVLFDATGIHTASIDPEVKSVTWSDSTVQLDSPVGDDILLGKQGQSFVYFIRMNGEIVKFDPDNASITQTGKAFTGARFATYDEKMGLIYVVNTWLGMIEIVAADTLRHLDRILIGHGARRVSPAYDEPGVSYLLSTVGIFRLSICERLPKRCATPPN